MARPLLRRSEWEAKYGVSEAQGVEGPQWAHSEIFQNNCIFVA
ncbi:MAG: hypothetical protein ACJASD_001091 [Sphingomonas echinoides]